MEFASKKTSLINKAATPNNSFVKEGLKMSAETTSGNGAKKYSTSNDVFVDNFAAIANFKAPRTYAEVSKDMYKLWSVHPKKCVQLAVYIRLITRETQIVLPKETINLDVQRGQGLKNEGIMRMLWLAIYHKPTFMMNMPLFIAAGSWKDVFEMMSLDLQYHGWEGRKLDWNFMRKTILAGLANGNTSELVKKYLPTIRSIKECKTVESQARTMIGQYLASCIYGNKDKEDVKEAKVASTKEPSDSRARQRKYRRLKQSGTAHRWQQLIAQKNLLELDFNTIHGRALSLLVGSKFLKNQGLIDKYTKWISGRKTAKYTGFVFELFEPLGGYHRATRLADYLESTINAQFNGLVETGKQNLNANTKLLVVRDISGSMTATAAGTKMSAYAIGKAMALYFSELLEGPFKGAYASFSNTCKLCKWQGSTPVEKWTNDTDGNFGSTNLQSVADLFVRLRTSMKVSENEFPTGALLISDGEFNRCGDTSNFEEFRVRLLRGGFSKEYVENFKLILWDLPNGYYGNSNRPKFEDFADAPNNFYISGYDPSAVAFILGTKAYKPTPRNATELFNAAMDQDLLNMIEIVNPKKSFKSNKGVKPKTNKK